MNNIAPSFLVAPLTLNDKPFKKAVVAVTAHETAGTIGFIISKPTNVMLYDLLQDLDIVPKVENQPVLYGGPLSKNAGFVLYEHTKGRPHKNSLRLTPTISISPSIDVLKKAALGKFKRFELILGYSGWDVGQLDSELTNGDWLHTPFFPEILFDVPIENRWQHTFDFMGIKPFAFVQVKGGAHA